MNTIKQYRIRYTGADPQYCPERCVASPLIQYLGKTNSDNWEGHAKETVLITEITPSGWVGGTRRFFDTITVEIKPTYWFPGPDKSESPFEQEIWKYPWCSFEYLKVIG